MKKQKDDLTKNEQKKSYRLSSYIWEDKEKCGNCKSLCFKIASGEYQCSICGRKQQ